MSVGLELKEETDRKYTSPKLLDRNGDQGLICVSSPGAWLGMACQGRNQYSVCEGRLLEGKAKEK